MPPADDTRCQPDDPLAVASTNDATTLSPEFAGYVVGEEIGRGGMGRVYAGREIALGREVAIKTLLPWANPERFLTEAALTARLAHPGIPPVYAVGNAADGRPFLAMKLIRGRTLADLLKARGSTTDDLPRLVQVFEQVAQAVAFAHTRGVIHRDLKPSNVMVGEFGEVQVMDWGLAREVGGPGDLGGAAEPSHAPPMTSGLTASLTATGTALGTPGYMPPEQACGEALTPAADVFALGAVLTEILTGAPAFVGGSPWEVVMRTTAGDLAHALERLGRCGAPPALVELAVRYLAEKPGRRPATAGAVAAEVGAYRAGVEHRLRRAEADAREAAVRDGERRKRQRVVAVGFATVIAALAAGVLGTTAGMIRAEAAAEAEKAARRQAQQRLTEMNDLDAAMQSILNEFVVSEFVSKPTCDKDATRLRLDELASDARRRFPGGRNVALRTAALNFLASGYLALGSHPQAGDLLEECLRERSEAYGPSHPATLQSVNNKWHWAANHAGDLEAAEAGIRANLADCRSTLGPDHSLTLTAHNNLAYVLWKARKFAEAEAEAEAEARDCLANRLRVQGEDYPQVYNTRSLIAAAVEGLGRPREAIAERRRMWETASRLYGANGERTLSAWDHIDRLYEVAGQPEERTAWQRAHPRGD